MRKKVLWILAGIVSLGLICCGICYAIHISEKPYQEIENLISTKTLTARKCKIPIKPEDEKETYYNYLKNDRGKEIIGKYLKKYKDENDIESCLWLIDVLPYPTNEENITEELSTWIISYGKKYGRYSAYKETPTDRDYMIYYELENYYISVPVSDGEMEQNRIGVSKKGSSGIRGPGGDIIAAANSPSYSAVVPYVGMDIDDISRTRLGAPDETERCLDYESLLPERRSITYRWYRSNGEMIFYAHALAGKVIVVGDYRN